MVETPAERRYARNKETILAAAREIFREDGLDKFSMRSLADKADYSASAIYKYFNNKQEILEALRAEGWQLLNQFSAKRNASMNDSVEAVIQSGLAWFDFVRQYPDYFKLMVSESSDDRGGFDALMSHPGFQRLVKNIQQLVDNKVVRLIPGTTVQMLAFNFFASIEGYCSLQTNLFKVDSPEFEAFLENSLRQYMAYLMG
jgi:AcrR family transcriptional regulator